MKKQRYRPYVGRRKFPMRPLLRALLILILAGAACFAVLLGQILFQGRDHIVGDPRVMVVLGCQVREDGPSILLRDRLDTALAYLEDHPETVAVLAGARGENEPSTEARAMADYLAQRGVDRDSLLLEEESCNTFQNLLRTRQLLEQRGDGLADGGILIVSNGFHLARAKLLAGRLGFTEISTLAAPASHWPTAVKMYIREPIALVKSFLIDREGLPAGQNADVR